MNKRDRDTARTVCDKNLWLASICLNPHLVIGNPRLLAASAAHLLHAANFRAPKPACTTGEQQTASKRRRLHQNQHSSATKQPAGDPIQQLHEAACVGDVARLEQLCQPGNGVDVNAACGPQGQTALHAAAEAGSVEACRALLGAGADTYCADDSGTSPLMMAAAHGHHAALKVLLEAGADPFHVCYAGVNPLMCAARCGSSSCIQLLLAEGVDADYANSDLGEGEHALQLAAASGSVAAVRLLLAAGARVNRADKAGHTALWAAARSGHALVVQLLLSQPGIKHIRSYGECGTTPLEEAQAAHHTSCVALLTAHCQQHQQLPPLQQQQQSRQAAQQQSRKASRRQQQQQAAPARQGDHQQQQPRLSSQRARGSVVQQHQLEPPAAVVH